MASKYPPGHASRKITIGCLEALARQHCPRSKHNTYVIGQKEGRGGHRNEDAFLGVQTVLHCFTWFAECFTKHGRHIERRLESDVQVDYKAMFLRGYLITTSMSAHACYGASHTHTHTQWHTTTHNHTQPHTQPHTHNHHHTYTDTGTQTHTQT
jgi:hypothetical protein